MNEREELQRAREELKSSIKVVQKNLKIFGKAVVSSQKAALRNVGNNIINTYKQLQSDIYIHKLNKEIARYQKERITDFTSSQIAKLAEYRLRRQEEAEIRANIMRYKNALDREIYNNRHNVYTSKKEELKRALLEERNRLLNIQSEELGDKPKSR